MAYGDTPEQIVAREQADAEKQQRYVRLAVKVTVAVTVASIVVWLGARVVSPQLNLYKANTEKKAAIAEARAQSDAAEYTAHRKVEIATAEAEADRIRAKGISDANATIASSLTPEYIRWYFVDRLDDIDGQIIYVPTEAGVPLPEAGRAVKEEEQR